MEEPVSDEMGLSNQTLAHPSPVVPFPLNHCMIEGAKCSVPTKGLSYLLIAGQDPELNYLSMLSDNISVQPGKKPNGTFKQNEIKKVQHKNLKTQWKLVMGAKEM